MLIHVHIQCKINAKFSCLYMYVEKNNNIIIIKFQLKLKKESITIFIVYRFN